jgi:hypothetical protein
MTKCIHHDLITIILEAFEIDFIVQFGEAEVKGLNSLTIFVRNIFILP